MQIMKRNALFFVVERLIALVEMPVVRPNAINRSTTNDFTIFERKSKLLGERTTYAYQRARDPAQQQKRAGMG